MVVSREEARLLCREAPKRKAASHLPIDYAPELSLSRRQNQGHPGQAIWYLVRKVPQSMRAFKSPLTLTEKAREQWRVEQEKYAEKQQYKWKHLTPESSKSP
ncbi:Hypothetical protein NCS54_00294600 [Fusarium falciforme]|uniref:Hypothetical protein n=1 Tax=Fusarium falciforme TaxID=195108 RepID=UPI0023000069|nr:Hypothetical protein NCS54_00294600 [Fusarium falciforme]WAO85698.1 Hypothetical protein NCS54_00294600 [Fusarium falciforme]